MDINGSIHYFDGTDTLSKQNDGTITYTSSLRANNSFYDMDYISYFNVQTFSDTGMKYNFKVSAADGYNYYFYSERLASTSPGSGNYLNNYPMYPIAVEDKYGNYIKYGEMSTNENGENVRTITDTYGRDIVITIGEKKCTVSYYDTATASQQKIVYSLETLPASSLDNNSSLYRKEIERFTVTNQLGEKTVYDARPTETIAYYRNLLVKGDDVNDIEDLTPSRAGAINVKHSNVERIIYPTGAETRYEYKMVISHNSTTKAAMQVYAVTKSYDVENNTVVNEKEYGISNETSIYSIEETDKEKDRTAVTTYNKDGLKKTEEITKTNNSNTLLESSYGYDDCGYLSYSDISGAGLSMTTTYTNDRGGRVLTAITDTEKREYTYYSDGTVKTQKVYVRDNRYDTRWKLAYYYETTDTGISGEVEYERYIEDNIIKSQVKYEYDSEGNVIKTIQWTNDTNVDGVLDENDDVIVKENTYTTNDDKTLKLTATVNDVINIDGEDEGSVSVQYKMNMFGTPETQTDPYGAVTSIGYDILNRPVKYKYANGAETTVEYDLVNLYQQVTTPDGVSKKYTFDKLGRLDSVYRISGDGNKLIERYTYDKANRVKTKSTYTDSSVGIKEEYQYDPIDRVTERKVYSLESRTPLLYTETTKYDSGTSTTATTAEDGTVTAKIRKKHDSYNRLVSVEQISDDIALKTSYKYDELGNMTAETDPNGNVTSYEYDCFGRIISETNPDGNTSTTEYDLAGREVAVTNFAGDTMHKYYDKPGRLIQIVTPFRTNQNAVTKMYYDKNSNVIKTSSRERAEHYVSTEYKYDVMGNLVAEIKNDGKTDIVTQYEYDTANRMTKHIKGLSEYSENPEGGAVTRYIYGENGFLEEEYNPTGDSIYYFEYDYVGNVKFSCEDYAYRYYTYGPYGLTRKHFYLRGDTDVNYTYNNLGQITNTTNKERTFRGDGTTDAEITTTESFAYDPFGRLSEHTSNDGSVQKYTYDKNSNVTAYELIADEVVKNNVSYSYDKLNRLTSLETNGVTTEYTYDVMGNMLSKETSNGVLTNYTYNKTGLPLSMTTSVNGDEIKRLTTTYTFNGWKIRESDSYETHCYDYDNAGRLVSENAMKGNYWLYNFYRYDLRGNRISQYQEIDDYTDINYTYTYDMSDRMLSETINYKDNETEKTTEINYTYDERGNLTNSTSTDGTVKDYVYDRFYRLVKYKEGDNLTVYEYTADNLRAAKIVNGERTEYVWDGMNMAHEHGSETDNTYAYDMTGVHMSGGDVYIKDGHGNVIGSYGTATGSADVYYDAFGNVIYGSEQPTPFDYCGEYRDEESGLIYLRNRYYDSNTGRFITEDPIQDGLNWYSYCDGNPVMFVDPSGLYSSMIRYIIEKNGGTVSYDDYTRIATISMNGYSDMKLSVDDENENTINVSVGGKNFTTEGTIINGRIIVKDTFIMDNFNLSEEQAVHNVNDSFYCESDAAIAFGLRYNCESKNARKEYGAIIHKQDNKYSYNDIVIGDTGTIDVSLLEPLITDNSCAMVHTHGAYPDEGNYPFMDFLSVADAEYARSKNIGVYAITPGNYVVVLNSNYRQGLNKSLFAPVFSNDMDIITRSLPD